MPDVIVLGGGPAGVAAALEAARAGLEVEMLDEARSAGGQVYRAFDAIRHAHGEPEAVAGNGIREELRRSTVSRRFLHRVWHVEAIEGVYCVHAIGPEGALSLEAPLLIVATGARERHVPVPGWESPGVMGLAAATILLKAHRVLPGRNVVVAGSGPLLVAVSAGILKSGGNVAAIVDCQPLGSWLRSVPQLLSRPDLLARGIGWMAGLVMGQVPFFRGAAVRSIAGNPSLTHVEIGPVPHSAGPRKDSVSVSCDALCMGYGLAPAVEVTRLLGARHRFDPGRGGWHVDLDDRQRTSVPGLFACGEAGGVAGAAAAEWSGKVAGREAVRSLMEGANAGADRLSRQWMRRRDRAAEFGAAMARLSWPAPALLGGVGSSTTVCLCEGVTRESLERAIDAGARTHGALKSATRCGMGPCGGRVCEDAVADLLALRLGVPRGQLVPPLPRPPLRPVALDALASIAGSRPEAQPAPL